MALLTGSFLTQRAATKTFSSSEKLLLENRSRDHRFDIFLSHSFLDRDKVKGMYTLLTDMGYSVYVDWINDPQLDRKNVTKESAELVRQRMKCSASLLLATSANAEMSKWIPWELGYVDGHTSRAAIVPVTDERQTPRRFERSEYLLLYPYIKLAGINYSEELFLVESGYKYVSLAAWMKGNGIESKSQNIDLL